MAAKRRSSHHHPQSPTAGASKRLMVRRIISNTNVNSIHLRDESQNLEQRRPSEAMRMTACEMARQMYMQDFAGSSSQRILEETRKLPKFTPEEITKGPLLGSGGFGIVFEVSEFHISPLQSNDNAMPPCPSSPALEGRKFIAEHCVRPSSNTSSNAQEARYAIKTLRADICSDQTDLCQALADLNVETRILSSIEHPNIIKLRAIGKGPRFHQEYFIVLDRLYDTLEARMQKWKHCKAGYKGLAGKWRDPAHTHRLQLWRDRLLAAYDLSSAVAYLHEHRIIHRDLKPQNIGFDIRDDIKLFDFGLAKELPPPSQADANCRFCMSVCGSIRYMPPEIGMDQPYNETCDVYSLALVIWEMFALRQPFDKYTHDDDIVNAVTRPPYKRPLIKQTWPTPLQVLLHQSWHPLPERRPAMKAVEECLQKELVQAQNGSADHLDHLQRRSTFVFHSESSMLRNRLLSMRSAAATASSRKSHQDWMGRDDSAIEEE